VVTAETLAVKVALVAPAATVTDEGTATAVLSLESPTVRPLDPAGALSVTVHESVPEPVIEPVVQAKPLSAPAAAVPVPVSATERFPPGDASVTVPVSAPVVWGVNWTFRL
jgi:hypothetical protein